MRTPPTEAWRERRRAYRDGEIPLLDVRSEGEFAIGAIPGAVNLPLLADAERHEVGLAYHQSGRIEATQLGLGLFAAKCADFGAAVERLAAGRRKVAVHCWRGGLRSTAVATWLAAQGYDAIVLRGGYKAYRTEVLAALDALAERDLLVLDGRTGAGKTDLLRRFEAGFPRLDLEGLARHRGSAFGDFAQSGPVATQQEFENRLADAALDLPPTGEILVEIEALLGPIYLHPRLKDRIMAAPLVHVARDFDDRVERLTREYSRGWTDGDDARFEERSVRLKKHVSRADLARVTAAVRARDFREAVTLLLQLRYDKIYDKGMARREHQVVARFDLTREEDAAMAWIRARIQAGGVKP